jgi:hypothetical protein
MIVGNFALGKHAMPIAFTDNILHATAPHRVNLSMNGEL